jgi:hypothetical protein
MRCGTSGASGHVTTKPSIRKWDVLYKSGVYAQKALCLTPGGLYGVRLAVWLKYCGTAGKPGGEQRKQTSACSRRYELRREQSSPTAVQESAEGIVVHDLVDEGPNGMSGRLGWVSHEQ